MGRIDRPLVDSRTLGFARRADVADGGGEGQRSPFPTCPDGRRLARQDVDLRSGQKRIATQVRRIEGGVALCQRREPVPGRERRILTVVQRRHRDAHAQTVFGGKLDDEDVFLRVEIVEPEVLRERVGQRVVAGIQNAIGSGNGSHAGILASAHRDTRARVVAGGVDAAGARRLFGKDPCVDVHVGKDCVRNALGQASVICGCPGGGQAGIAGRDQLTFDEIKDLAAGVAGTQGDLDVGDERHATELIHQDVVVERPQRSPLGDVHRFVRHCRLRERREEQIGAGDTGIRGVPGAVKEGPRGRGSRRPGLVVQIDPLAAIVPVRAAGRYDDFVSRDLVHIVNRPFRRRAPQLRVHARQTRQYLRLGVEEVPRVDQAGGILREVGAALHRQEQQRSQSRGTERHGYRKFLHGLSSLEQKAEAAGDGAGPRI